MARTVREIERKYEAIEGGEPPTLTGLSALTGIPGVAAVTDRGTVDLDATYYDTADLRLAADGVTLRRRTGGADEGWHLKLPAGPGGGSRARPGGDVVRDEIHAPLSDEVPRDLASLARSRTRDAALAPLIRLRTRRDVRHLTDADGERLAEISVDQVTALRLASEEGATFQWTEVEVELAEGGPATLLDDIEGHLTAAMGVRPAAAASKLARALAGTERTTERKPGEPGRKPGRKPDKPERKPGRKPGKRKKGQAGGGGGEQTAGEVALAYARQQIAAIVALDPAVRLDTPDAVHRMRVATRRLRSALRSYPRLLDRAVTDPLGSELKWLAAELGVDRDREVLAARLEAALEEVPRTLRLGPVRARLRIWSHAQRRGSRTRLIAVLDGRRYLRLLDALDVLRTEPPEQATGPGGVPLLRPAAARPPGREIRKAVLRDFDRLAARVDTALATPAGSDRDLALHDARKAAKRARYAAEAAQLWLGEPAARLAGRITEIQQLLGDHQDSVMARKALRDIAVQAHAAGESAFTFGLLYGREEARAATDERALPELWAKVADAESL